MGSVDRKTAPGYVLTNEGHVPYRRHPKLGIDMPIKVINEGGEISPVKRGGRYVYALPGGGEYVA